MSYFVYFQETQTILDEQSEIQDLKESIQKIIDSNIQQLNLKIDRKKEEKERHSSKTTDEGLRDNGRGGCESSMNPLKNSMSAKVETMEASYRYEFKLSYLLRTVGHEVIVISFFLEKTNLLCRKKSSFGNFFSTDLMELYIFLGP